MESQSPVAFTTSTVGSSQRERDPGDGIDDTRMPPKYDNEPRTAAEVIIHPEQDNIEAEARKEMQQLKDTQTGVYPSEKDIADIGRRGHRREWTDEAMYCSNNLKVYQGQVD